MGSKNMRAVQAMLEDLRDNHGDPLTHQQKTCAYEFAGRTYDEPDGDHPPATHWSPDPKLLPVRFGMRASTQDVTTSDRSAARRVRDALLRARVLVMDDRCWLTLNRPDLQQIVAARDRATATDRCSDCNRPLQIPATERGKCCTELLQQRGVVVGDLVEEFQEETQPVALGESVTARARDEAPRPQGAQAARDELERARSRRAAS